MRLILIALALTSGPALAELPNLPLTLGYYIEKGESCEQGNDATLAYLHGAGMNNRFGMCNFTALKDEGSGLWSFASLCQDAEEGVEFINEGRLTIKSATAFDIYDGTQDLNYSFCPTESLSPQFR